MTNKQKNQTSKREAVDLAAIRERLAHGDAPQTWRSLEELAGTEAFLDFLHEEFPRETSWVKTLTRRDFLKLLAAPLALAGLSACAPQPAQTLVPYVEAPENLVPGVPLFFTTAMELDGYGRGLLVESHMGRPTKIEGNPQHPASLGATDAFGQGAILSLYDPQRAQEVRQGAEARSWEDFQAALADALEALRPAQGEGLHILTETVTSPTAAFQLQEITNQFPRARWHQYDPVGRDQVRAGAVLAFGEMVDPLYSLQEARVILCLDDDLFSREPGSLRYIREFAAGREVLGENAEMNRLYVVESSLTNTGASADHRLALPAAQIEPFARALARALGVEGISGDAPPAVPEGWMEALAADLIEHRGSSLVVAGPQQPAAVHALAHQINFTLENTGRTVFYTDPVEANPVDQTRSLRELVEALEAGRVRLLVILSDNPAYTAPADLNFAEAISGAELSVHLSLYPNETSRLAGWHIPRAHFLEAWGDTRAYDGTATITQPLIQPLYNGRSVHEVLALLQGQTGADPYQLVRRYWESAAAVENFDQFWREALRSGVIPNTQVPVREVSLRGDFAQALEDASTGEAAGPEELEIVFAPDPHIWDGRFSKNAWLQELPKPLTKLTWDNAALVSPTLALALDLSQNQVVELHLNGRRVLAPVYILPGLPENSVTVHLGYGHPRSEALDSERGFNAYTLRSSDSPWFQRGLEIVPTAEVYPLAETQHHWSMEGRDLVKVANLAEFQENPELFLADAHAAEAESPGDGLVEEPPSLYPEYAYEGHAWGMTINLSACIGCNACVIACQAENNIPVVGKEQVMAGREMHWLRVDRYFKGDLEAPEVLFQPIPCMHCEKAPCEPVCPVEATVHGSEGLNEMIYPRCIGTRYCSNNCPYKVRRFNFLQYAEEDLVPLKLLNNPDVTVRSRGVMEKCTYCIQRIQDARVEAELEGRPLRDGEVVTACQQACPASAIQFGDINDENARVRMLKSQPQNYGLLAAELGTQPRTSYLGKLRNPNPRMNG